mmetsp:Transcript_10277/g.30957  ORF Transcript_10277/g.30957 Transcript_10277/m.30957 type:complete len:211 (-) Transcript_10277:573-1205(-)
MWTARIGSGWNVKPVRKSMTWPCWFLTSLLRGAGGAGASSSAVLLVWGWGAPGVAMRTKISCARASRPSSCSALPRFWISCTMSLASLYFSSLMYVSAAQCRALATSCGLPCARYRSLASFEAFSESWKFSRTLYTSASWQREEATRVKSPVSRACLTPSSAWRCTSFHMNEVDTREPLVRLVMTAWFASNMARSVSCSSPAFRKRRVAL